MRRRRIRQWAPGEVTLEAVTGQVRRGEWFVVRDDHTVVAAVRVLTNDDSAWGSRPQTRSTSTASSPPPVRRSRPRSAAAGVGGVLGCVDRPIVHPPRLRRGQLRPALSLPCRRLPRGRAPQIRSARRDWRECLALTSVAGSSVAGAIGFSLTRCRPWAPLHPGSGGLSPLLPASSVRGCSPSCWP